MNIHNPLPKLRSPTNLFRPFTLETATLKVRQGEDGWNSRNPEKVALAYSIDCVWRNRAEFITGRQEIIAFLKRKWAKEIEYRLIKELWAYRDTGSRCVLPMNGPMAAANGFARMETRNWEFTPAASWFTATQVSTISKSRKQTANTSGPLGRRPDDHPSLSYFGF